MVSSKNKVKSLLMTLSVCGLSNAQVAINNINPQGTFHVDGAKDNPATGVPTAAQQANDFIVKADGKAGIGTTTPQTKLDIVTLSNSNGIQHTDGTITLRSYVGTGMTNNNTQAGWLGTSSNHPLDFMTNNIFRLRIDNNGNVGIAQAFIPSAKLEIKTHAGAMTDALAAGINNCGGSCPGQTMPRNIALYNANSSNGTFAGIDFIPSTSATGLSGAGIWGMDRDATNHYAGMHFYTRNATDYAPRVTIRSSGNVGIGTTDPQARLHISTPTVKEGFQLQDGSQGAGKILASDAQGKASWTILPSITAAVLGTLNTTERTVGSNTLINSSITLPTGRWLVYVGQLVRATEASTVNRNLWMRITLSNSNTALSYTGFSFLGSSMASGWTSTMIRNGMSSLSFISGVIPVEVTAPNTTLYSWFAACDIGSNGSPGTVTTGSNSENYLFALPFN